MTTKSDSGVWIDTDTGKITHRQPVNSRLLVAPGHEVTAADQATIDLYTDNHETATAERQDGPGVDVAPHEADVDAPQHADATPAKKAPAKAR